MPKDVILVLDLDGTIIRTGEPLDTELANILQEYRQKSRLIIVTARHPMGVEFVLGNCLGFVPTISLNGGGLHLHSWDKFDRVIYFPSQTVKKIREELSPYDVTISYYGKDFWAVSKITPEIQRESIVTGMVPSIWKEYYDDRCIKISIICSLPLVRFVRFLLKKNDELLKLSMSHPTYLELSPPSVSKCMFLPVIFKRFFQNNKRPLEVFFVGDSENDIDCAKVASKSWTFPSAPPELKQVCTGILPYDDGLGLKELLKNLNSYRKIRDH
jgi:HAD superfamily hydrolase (TIGR01484 family)